MPHSPISRQGHGSIHIISFTFTSSDISLFFLLRPKTCTQIFVQVLFKYPQVSFQIELKQLSSGGWINKLWCRYSAITYILKNHCNLRNCAMKIIGLQGNRVGTQHASTSSMTPWKNQESNKIVAQLYICEIININTTVNMIL